MQDDKNDPDDQEQTNLTDTDNSNEPEQDDQEQEDLGPSSQDDSDDSYAQDPLADEISDDESAEVDKTGVKPKKPKHLLMLKLFLIFSSVIAVLAIAASTVTILVFKDRPIDQTTLANAIASLDTLETLPFTEDKSVFINPEKGFYKPLHSENISNSEVSGLKSKNISLILVETNLAVGPNGDYHQNIASIKNSPLTAAKLAEIDNAFSIARNNGVKIIFRAAYDYAGIVAPEPTDKAVMLNHIAQLKPVLAKNEDVLYTVQAGFLGSWGEWHSTRYGLKETDEGVDYKYNEIPAALQREVAQAVLDATPVSRTVNIREPRYLRYINNGVTINDTTAFNGSSVSRLGFHNDGLFYDINDCGTYSLQEIASGKVEYNRAQEMVWMNTQMKYAPFGGESNGNSSYSDAAKAVADFNSLHAQYINIDYYVPVIDKWKNSTYNSENTFNYISRNLGYKYLLTDAQISSKVYSGGAMHLKLNIKNDGFGGLINERNPEIIISNGVNTYKAKTGEDARKWYRENGLMTKDMYFSIPSDVPAGTYNIYLNLPDKNVALSSKPAYSIRLANTGVWDPVTGYNLIKKGLVIEDTGLANNNTFAQINRTSAENLLGVSVNTTVSSVTLDKTSVSLEVGKTANLVATVLPVEVVEKGVSYVSSNSSIVTVDPTGKLTAVAPGTATVTATSIVGGKTATSQITVTAAPVIPTEPVIVPVSSITLTPSSLSMIVGSSSDLTATILPLNATNLNKSYVSANPNVASVSLTGKVTAVAPGNTNITVTSVGSGKTSVATVNVTQPVVSVNLPVQNLSILVGATYSLTGSVSPSNATNQKINYSSSNNSIAMIDTNGLTTGVSAGTAIITATSADGSKTATCNLTVTQSPVSNVSDWATINPIAQKTTGGARTLKVYNNQSTIYMLVNGSGLNAKSQFYIDADNNPNTGLKTMWLASGIDYLIENNNLYRYTGSNNNWSFRKVSSVSLTKRDSLIGASVAFSKMGLSVGSVIHVGFLGNDSSSNILPVRSLQLPSYTLTNSTNTISF